MKTINFLATSDNKTYDMFILPFILSVLHHVPNSYCEILMRNSQEFKIKHSSILDVLYYVYGDKILLRDIPDYYDTADLNYKYIGQLVRFLETPIVKCDYTYIGDIDIITFEKDIIEIHENLMLKQELCYSNIIRHNSKRLTGCMCVKTDEYYLAVEPKFEQFKSNPEAVYFPILNDEILLYHLVTPVLGFPKYNDGEFRPIHGVHISLNRPNPIGNKETGELGWGINDKVLTLYNDFKETSIYKQISAHFDIEFINIISKLNNIEKI